VDALHLLATQSPSCTN